MTRWVPTPGQAVPGWNRTQRARLQSSLQNGSSCGQCLGLAKIGDFAARFARAKPGGA